MAKQTYEEIKEKAADVKVKTNVEKSKVMEMRTKGRLGQNWNTGNDNIEVVQEFNYLGNKVNDNKAMMQEIRNKILKCSRL